MEYRDYLNHGIEMTKWMVREGRASVHLWRGQRDPECISVNDVGSWSTPSGCDYAICTARILNGKFSPLGAYPQWTNYRLEIDCGDTSGCVYRDEATSRWTFNVTGRPNEIIDVFCEYVSQCLNGMWGCVS